MGTSRTDLSAPAKLTLSLSVRERRNDGYHEVEGLCAAMTGLEDRVGLEVNDGPGCTVEVSGHAEGVPVDASNLAVRAAEVFLERVGSRAGAHVRLHKMIPPGAGLGGGSSDAAAVLVGLATLLDDTLDGADLEAMGAELGSDVPFCVRGGLGWIRGRGELVESVGDVAGWGAVVAVPPVHASTPAVYARWDEMGAPRAQRRITPPRALRSLAPAVSNDLEDAALSLYPALEAFRDRFGRLAGREPIMAGSGSAWFTLWDASEAADAASVVAAIAGGGDLSAWCLPAPPRVRPSGG